MKKVLVILVTLLLICANVFVPTASAWNLSGELNGVVNNTTCTGDFLISPDGMNWSNEFSFTDLFSVPVNSLPDRLAPVSFNPLNRSFTSISTDDLGLFTAFPASLNSYMKYTFYAKLPYTIQDSTVIQMAADFDSMASFAYAAVDVGSDIYLLHGVGSRSYVPVISSNGVIGVDANSNDIVDSSETDLSNFGPTVTASTSPMTIPLTFTENGEIKTITVYMWAEGQDPACRGPIPAFTAGISISIDAPTVANHLGDINGDGNVSSTDALMALQASSGLLILNEEQLVSADVNDSKGVTSVDALIILQYSAGLITTF